MILTGCRRWMRAILVSLSIGCLAAPADELRDRVAKVVSQIQAADFHGDRSALEQLDRALAVFQADQTTGSRVCYWRGFALWRMALNGFNASAGPAELDRDLHLAMRHFDDALVQDRTLVEARIGKASCIGNLIFLHSQEPSVAQDLIRQGVALIDEIKAAAPEDPRFLWVLGSFQWNTPNDKAGGQARATATYQKGLEICKMQKGTSSDPLDPSWGEPELLMSLAWSNLNRSTPDLVAADQYAQAALELVPSWHYVKDRLIPQIRAARATQQK